MSSCYLGDHIGGDHIHTDITAYDIKEPQQKYRLGTASNRLLMWEGSLNMFCWIQTSPFASTIALNSKSAWRCPNPWISQHRKQTSYSDKICAKSERKTRQKQRKLQTVISLTT